MNETDLRLEIIGQGNSLGPFSSRECIQTLSPLVPDSLRRTINGNLVSVRHPGHRKFKSTISCKDKAPPAFAGLWKGSILKVGCLQSLSHIVPAHTQQIQVERTPLSLSLVDYSGKQWTAQHLKEQWVAIPPKFPGGFLLYRPELIMAVQNYFLETDEWGATVGWQLELEEM
jgi:hypothetical protein